MGSAVGVRAPVRVPEWLRAAALWALLARVRVVLVCAVQYRIRQI